MNKKAFTLAEVLVTLGIIGIVAAMTLPALIQNYQKMVLKSQFKKVYTTLFNAIKLAQAKTGGPVYCYYWSAAKNPYGATNCIEYNEYGTCKKWELADGTPIPSDYNGLYSDCLSFYKNQLFGNVLKYSKYCPDNALANGCITEQYRGIDKIKAEIDDSVEYDPNMSFSDSRIKEDAEAWILVDGTVIVRYCNSKCTTPVFMVDINGHKRPNKWGYDIFTFAIKGTQTDGITNLSPQNYYYEKGGFYTSQMLFEAYR